VFISHQQAQPNDTQVTKPVVNAKTNQIEQLTTQHTTTQTITYLDIYNQSLIDTLNTIKTDNFKLIVTKPHHNLDIDHAQHYNTPLKTGDKNSLFHHLLPRKQKRNKIFPKTNNQTLLIDN